MSNPTYATPPGGMPAQTERLVDRAIFTTAYAVIPREVMRDIVTSAFPHWHATRAWVLARPLSGFAETFSQSILEIAPGGGSERPEPDPHAEGAFFVLNGTLTFTINGQQEVLQAGGFVWIAPGDRYTVANNQKVTACCQWIRKSYEAVDGIATPASFTTSDADTTPSPMANAKEQWQTTRFMDPEDMGHDMHITIVTLAPGAVIPFTETHVMEHGLYVLQGKGVYYLNGDWVEVEAGDFMWLRAFCPQACYAAGTEPFRYLLYKDVNRLPALGYGHPKPAAKQ